MIPLPAYRGAEVGVVGLGRSGQAAVAAFAAAGAYLHVWDDREELRRQFGAVPPFDPSGLDRLVWSPGIPHLHPRPHPLALKAYAAHVRPEADISLLTEAMPESRFVGVTGTNGKSTVTALIGHALGRLGVPYAVGGNLGPAALGLPALDRGGVYALELSSYQLALMARPAFNVAVLLNIAPDHLDRHGGMHRYAADKARIFGNRATVVIGDSDPWCRRLAAHLRTEGRTVVITGDDGPALPFLPGLHNRRNAAAALAALAALGIDHKDAHDAMEGFRGLPHRMETVGEIAGVRYVNDSKATNPESAAFALASFDRVRWIAGGEAKTDNLDVVRPWFGRIAQAYLIGASEATFADALAGHAACERLGDLDTALAAAHRDAQPGEVVLLAPAAASFDQWDSFEARGNAFRIAVRGLVGDAA